MGIYWALEATISVGVVLVTVFNGSIGVEGQTLNIGHALLKNLLENLGVLELLLDLGDDRLGQLPLLSLLDLALVSDPRVEDGLGLGSQGGLLLKLESLSLKLGGFL